MIVSVSNDTTIKIWNPSDKYLCIITLHGHSSYVNIVIKLNNIWIASGSNYHTIKLWQPEKDYQFLETFIGHKVSIRVVAQLKRLNCIWVHRQKY